MKFTRILISMIGMSFLLSSAYMANYVATPTGPLLTNDQERLQAATLLFQKNITKVSPNNTNYYEGLIRGHAALLLTRFASQVLQKDNILDVSTCQYSDLVTLAASDQDEIKTACRIGLFKSNDVFNPYGAFSRGQMVTVIARLLSNNSNMEITEAYDFLLHIGIVKVDDRNESGKTALRKDLYIMLGRIITSASQIATYSQYANTQVGNIHADTNNASIVASNKTQVFKLVGYSQNPLLKTYTPTQLGSSVLIKDNTIITNAHVVLDDNGNVMDGFEVCKEGENSTMNCFTTATLQYYDEDADLALLTLQGSQGLSKPVTISSSKANNGDEVLVWGYPSIGGTSITLTKGIISGIENGQYKSDVKIDHGNSGGGAFNKRGELIGIPNSSLEDTDTLSYIISSNAIQSFLQKKGGIVSFTAPLNTVFIKYIKARQTQANGKKITTPFFVLPSLNDMIITDYQFDAGRNLYSLRLGSKDAKTSMLIYTRDGDSTDIQENETMESKEDDYIACDKDESRKIGNAIRNYSECKDIINSENYHFATTSPFSGLDINAIMYSSAKSKKGIESAQSILDKIYIKKDAQVKNYDKNNLGEVIKFPDGSLKLTYTMIEGDIVVRGYLDKKILFDGLDIETLSPADVKLSIKNKSSQSYYGNWEEYYTDWYDIILPGITVKNSKNAIMRVFAHQDKKEDLDMDKLPMRTWDVTIINKHVDQYISVEFNLSYEGVKDSNMDAKIIDFLNNISVVGEYPFNDVVNTLPSVTSLSFS